VHPYGWYGLHEGDTILIPVYWTVHDIRCGGVMGKYAAGGELKPPTTSKWSLLTFNVSFPMSACMFCVICSY